MPIDTNHQRLSLGQWPRGCANLVANIIGQERQFDSRTPSSSNRLFANFLQSKLMIHPNLDFGFHDFEHQSPRHSGIRTDPDSEFHAPGHHRNNLHAWLADSERRGDLCDDE